MDDESDRIEDKIDDISTLRTMVKHLEELEMQLVQSLLHVQNATKQLRDTIAKKKSIWVTG